MKTRFFLFITFFALQGFATTPKEDFNLEKLSEAMGYLIGKNLDELGLKLDINKVVKGLKESSQGKTSPMSEEECLMAITKFQENLLQETAQKNLAQANQFLKENNTKKSIVEIEPGKLQYRIDHEGKGTKIEKHHCPLIRYTGKYLDGTLFGSSDEPEVIALDSTIEGFSKGLLGMKEGEKRTLFIHPDLGYQNTGILLPNSLLIFEVEALKADGSLESHLLPKEISQNTSDPVLR